MMSGRHQRGLTAAIATVLATAPLIAIFEDLGWLTGCLVTIAGVAGAATAARALRAPVWAQVLAMLAGWLMALTLLFSGGQGYVGIIPNSAVLAEFGHLLGMVGPDVRSHATPVPSLESLSFVTAAGVGLVAIVVDTVAAGLRRPALAGLPMLAIYSVPVAVSLDSVPLVLFGVGALGYLWLLGSDNMDRVRRFGRRFTGDGRDVEPWEPSPLAAAGRRLAVVGVLIAVALPLAVPGMTSGLVDRFGPAGGAGDGPGGSGGSGQLNLFAELHGQLNRDETLELVQVTTSDDDPFYLRLATADQVNESGFAPSAPNGLPVSGLSVTTTTPTGVAREQHRAAIALSETYGMSLAPTYADLVAMSGLSDDWHYDGEQQIVYAGQGQTPPDYEFTYLRPEYDPEALRQARRLPGDHAIQDVYAQVPDVAEVRELLDTLIDPSDTPYDQVRSILGLFSRENGFRYDLSTGPETGAPAIVDFLEDRAGFCVQYAAAMTWLVRSIDMPARVAFGFTRGRSAGDNTWVLTNRNLHAWTEVYFSGYGWVPFDPTPGSAVAGSASPGWAPNPQAPPEARERDSQANPGGEADATPGAGNGDNSLDNLADDVDFGGAPPSADPGRPWWVLILAAAVAALLLQPALHRSLLRRRRVPRHTTETTSPPAPAGGAVTAADATLRHRHRAHLAWQELIDTLIDLRVPLDPTETPRATARRLSHLLESGEAAVAGAAVAGAAVTTAAGTAVQTLGQAEERARYAREPMPADGLASALETVRTALTRDASYRTRMRARLLPPSTLLRWRGAMVDTSTTVLTSLNRIGEALARLSPRRLLRTAR